MAKSESAGGGLSFSHERSGCLPRLVLCIVLVLLILAITGVLVARSEGGRGFIAERIGQRLGMEVAVGESRIGWPYVLVLRDVSGAGYRDGGVEPGFRADEVRLGLTLTGARSVTVRGGRLRLVRAPEGTWQPAAFQGLGPLPERGLGELSHVTAGLRRRTRLLIEDSRIRWVGDGKSASARGIRFRLTPLGAPDRRLCHHDLEVDTASHPDGTMVQDVERQWLNSDRGDHLMLKGRGRGLPPAVRGFWDSVAPTERSPAGAVAEQTAGPARAAARAEELP